MLCKRKNGTIERERERERERKREREREKEKKQLSYAKIAGFRTNSADTSASAERICKPGRPSGTEADPIINFAPYNYFK